ncbi:MAG: 50S ribosomal protein L23 [Holosporales bacterium]|jgi:large subunit ribosomal protein L23|nr:50S ribosomal protein L23 [Holosporales bacterium]
MTDRQKATATDYDIVRYPVLTEKSTRILEKSNAYVFVVDKYATKPLVKRAVERIFGVNVVSVNTILTKGKRKVFRGIRGRRADYKKAMVKLKAGESIELGAGA